MAPLPLTPSNTGLVSLMRVNSFNRPMEPVTFIKLGITPFSVRTLKKFYADENIVAVDYDPSATRVNQENRIKLMLAQAREKQE